MFFSAMQMEPLRRNHSRSDPAGPATIRQGQVDLQSNIMLQSDKPYIGQNRMREKGKKEAQHGCRGAAAMPASFI
jgi:hypothetical protein